MPRPMRVSIMDDDRGLKAFGRLEITALRRWLSKMDIKDFLPAFCTYFYISLNIILTQKLLFCIIRSDSLENTPLVITKRKQ